MPTENVTGSINVSGEEKMKHRVTNPAQALAYITDCTLATVSKMALLKSKNKAEYNRQIGIAQTSIEWMVKFGVSMAGTRAIDVLKAGSVEKWASQYLPDTQESNKVVG